MRVSVRTVFSVGLWLTIAAVGAATLASEFGSDWWLTDLASHFRYHYLFAALVMLAVATLRRANSLAAAAILVASAQIFAIAEAPRLAPAVNARPGMAIRIASINVLWSNKRFGDFRALVEREKPDVLVMQEVALGWWGTVEGLNKTLYPHRAPGNDDEKRNDFALLTRFPILEHKLVFLPGQRFGYLEAVLDIEGRRVRLIAVHPPYPLSSDLTAIHRRHLDAYAEAARRSAEPVLIVGDFNLTPYSPRFRRFLASAGLAYAHLPWLWPRTWPSSDHPSLLGQWFRGFPIDHVAASRDFAAIAAWTASGFASDHKAVFVDLRLMPRR